MPRTIECEGAVAKPGEGLPRKHAILSGKPLVDKLSEKVTTLYENLLHGASLSSNEPFMGTRSILNGAAGPYDWIYYDEAVRRAKNIGAFMANRKIPEKANIGLYSVNRVEWVLAEQGCFSQNYVTVPLYDTLGTEAIQYIVNQTEQQIVFASKDKIKNLIDLKSSLPSLKIIVSMDPVEEELKSKAKEHGVELIAIDQAEEEGAKSSIEVRPPKPDDLATICYTSGTTGLPKGAMLTHKNILSVAHSYHYAADHYPGAYKITKEDSHISYLPLAHVFERAVFNLLIGVGARIGFYQGDTLKLLEDVAELCPTIFVSVPRLFNRIFDKVWANVKAKGGISEKLFNFAFGMKKSNLSNSVKNILFDAIVFRKVRARLGGRVRFILSGSAPLSPEVMEFLRIAFACEVLEGYGQTECAAGSTITETGDYSVGHIGVPFPCNEVKLVDIPEMDYKSTDKPFARGEICIRGHNVFKGYYKQPEKTAETLDEDGWLHTGDVGLWDAEGRLKIIDRKKNIFKLSQGEYIAPEKIENVYINNEFVAQAFVYGDSLQSTLVGIIVPDQDILKAWAAQHGYGSKTFQELCKMEEVKKHMLAVVTQHGKLHDLKGFENVKNIYLEPEPFTLENDMLTPTFKLKRFEASKRYKKQIDALYAEINSASA